MTTTTDQLHDQIEHLFATPDLFRSWLQSKEDDEIVGQANYGESCPLATFLHDQGIGNVYVFAPYVESDIEGEVICETPGWARKFVEAIDMIHPVYIAPSAVSAKEALLTLTAITLGDAS